MKMEEVRSLAKALNIKSAHLSKAELIKSIQTEEGNFDCFATAAGGDCDQIDCLWRKDCFAAADACFIGCPSRADPHGIKIVPAGQCGYFQEQAITGGTRQMQPGRLLTLPKLIT